MKKRENQKSAIPSDNEIRERFAACLKERLDQFVALAEAVAADSQPETVHDLRVASRRLRVAAGCLELFGDEHATGRLIRPVSSITGHLGRLRDVDEALAFFQKEAPKAASALLKQLCAAREAEQLKTIRRLKRLDLQKLSSEYSKSLKTMAKIRPEQSNGLIATLSERNLQLFRPINALQTLLNSEENHDDRHAYRIAVKKWRYFTELLEQLFGCDMHDLLERLKMYQTTLGAMNDRISFLEMLVGSDLAAGVKERLETKLIQQQNKLLTDLARLKERYPLHYVFRVQK